ncbi:MAG: hypothetical protein Q9185_004650 [Variospora sp. 1 TL-2023]
MSPSADLQPRQIWADPNPTSTSPPRHCTPVRLPSGGLLSIVGADIITLTHEAVFQPYCTSMPEFNANASTLEPIDKDPFYASTLPQMYAIAAVTVVSYLLVIMLIITPRTFFVGGLRGGSGFLRYRGMISGASGSTSVVGVGGRPWLQKVAAWTVAISMTIASVDTFRAAERQYAGDYSDASALTNEVVNSLELRVIRVVSETFLWLAQAQTLIRLFPRHKEKVIIKWAGFVLVGLDTIFRILYYFVSWSGTRAPRSFQDAIPALSYLFTLCLNLIYAAWIIYYSLSKRRYAFLHPKMRSICLVALLSYVAVLIPVVFFILDISIYDVAGWGNYVRWVGAAAASVVVWEWVERIEALEADERKDGILGREIFDGDEMLEVTPSSALTWANSRRGGGSGGVHNTVTSLTSRRVPSIIQRINRKRQRSMPKANQTSRVSSSHLDNEYAMTGARHGTSVALSQPTPSTTAAAPSSTSDFTKPESPCSQGDLHSIIRFSTPQPSLSDSASRVKPPEPDASNSRRKGQGPNSYIAKSWWSTLQRLPVPFFSRHMSPPIEVKQAVLSRQQPGTTVPQTLTGPSVPGTSSLLDRLGLRGSVPAPKVPLPVTVVPAPPRNTTSWSDVRGFAPSSRPLSQNVTRNSTRSGLSLDSSGGHWAPIGNPTGPANPPAHAPTHQLSRSSSVRLSQAARVGDDEISAREPSRDSPSLSRLSMTGKPASHVDEQHAERPGSSGPRPDHASMPQAPDSTDKAS